MDESYTPSTLCLQKTHKINLPQWIYIPFSQTPLAPNLPPPLHPLSLLSRFLGLTRKYVHCAIISAADAKTLDNI